MTEPQRRQFSRIVFRGEARLLDGDREWPCEVLDLSLKGALLDVGTLPAEEDSRPRMLELHLDAENVVRMEGHIVHRSGTHAGLACTEIDLDSLTHLRRLVELNLGDPDLLEREFSALISA